MHKELALLGANRTGTQAIQTPRQQLQIKYFTHSHSTFNANNVAVIYTPHQSSSHIMPNSFARRFLTIAHLWLVSELTRN